MSDIIDRDDVSTWCYDGMCQHCDSDWCDHRCHEPLGVDGTPWAQILRGAVIALAVGWSAAGIAGEIAPESWPTLARVAVMALSVVAAIPLSRWLVAGLTWGGDDHDER